MNFVHKSTFEQKEQKFTLRIRPCNQLIIIGAGHISQVLSKLSVAMDLDVTVIEPRSIFLSEKRFPNVATRLGWPQDILPELHVDEQTAIVTLTHDPKIDDPALLYSLKTNAYYIGCLGSAKTHRTRLDRLKKAGFTEHSLSRLHEHTKLVYPTRFFDILYENTDMFSNDDLNLEFLPGIDFKELWKENISDNTRECIWKYLQLILFSIITTINNKESLGNNAQLFEAINSDEFKNKLGDTMKEMEKLFNSTNLSGFSKIK